MRCAFRPTRPAPLRSEREPLRPTRPHRHLRRRCWSTPLPDPPVRPTGERDWNVQRTATALTQYGFRLTESAKAAGLDFVHERADARSEAGAHHAAGRLDGSRGVGRRLRRDGLSDLYVTDSKEGSKNRLYRNRGNGTFEEVAARMGVADLNHSETGVSMGAVWGDYDNDGFEDLFLYRWGRPELFHNDRGQRLHAGHRHRRPASVGQRQHRGVARLRPRRPPRSVRRRLLLRNQSTCGSSPTRG